MASASDLAAGTSATSRILLFVKVKSGSAVAYRVAPDSVVSELLKVVKIVEELTVGVGQLKLYESEKAYQTNPSEALV